MKFYRCLDLVPTAMTVGLPRPVFRNGIGMYIPQVRRLVLRYCDRGGSSRGVVEWLHKNLTEYAEKRGHIEFVVVARPSKHPTARGLFLNGREKTVCLKNLKAEEVADRLRLITEFEDAKTPAHVTHNRVVSTTPAIRGLWTPFRRMA